MDRSYHSAYETSNLSDILRTMLVVQACIFADDGDALYRLHDPCAALGALPGITTVDCDLFHRHFFTLAEECDILVFPYLQLWELFPLIEARRNRGKVSVFETNDFYDDLHPWNPLTPAWLDPDVSAVHRQMVQHADAIQTSSSYLASHWAGDARRTALFRNQLRNLPALPQRPDRSLTIGWGGSAGHLGDWYAVTPVLQRWLDRNTAVRCAVMTYRHARSYLDLPPDRYDFRDFGSLDDYSAFLRGLDIGVVPLLDTPYNRGRSDVKFLEFAAHGVVGIYPRTGPYAETVVEGETGLLFGSDDELVDCLDRLAGDPGLREKIRNQAHRYVAENRMLAPAVGERAAFYRSLLGHEPESRPHPVLASYHPIAGSAYRLPREPMETAYTTMTERKPSEELVAGLRSILRQEPGYLFGAVSLARTLNDLKRPREALEVAATFPGPQRSYSPSLENEEGRALFLLGETEKAIDRFNRLLGRVPEFIPGWQYLLRAMHATGISGGRAAPVVELMRRRYPSSISLGVLAAGLTAEPRERAAALAAVLEKVSRSGNPDRSLFARRVLVPAVLDSVRGLDGDEALTLLERAELVFPESFLLKERRAALLRARGDHAISNAILADLAGKRRSALVYGEEFPATAGHEPTRHLTWLVGEHLSDSDRR
jgi:tetratricopeptide (TPR) repeat protein